MRANWSERFDAWLKRRGIERLRGSRMLVLYRVKGAK